MLCTLEAYMLFHEKYFAFSQSDHFKDIFCEAPRLHSRATRSQSNELQHLVNTTNEKICLMQKLLC